jgi:hypothetical protein
MTTHQPPRESSPRLARILADIWMLLVLLGFVWIRVLDSDLFRPLIARLRPH